MDIPADQFSSVYKQRRAGCISVWAMLILLSDNARIVYNANGQGRTHQIFSCYDSLLVGPHDSFSAANKEARRCFVECVYINQARGCAEQGTSTPILAQTFAPSGLERGNIFCQIHAVCSGNLLFY